MTDSGDQDQEAECEVCGHIGEDVEMVSDIPSSPEFTWMCKECRDGGGDGSSSEKNSPTGMDTGSGGEPPKPDAWAWEKYILGKTSSVWLTTTAHPEKHAEELVEQGEFESASELNKVPKTEEPLFSAETIQEAIEELFEKYEQEGYGYPESIRQDLLEVFDQG